MTRLVPAEPPDYEFAHALTRDNMGGYVARFWGGWDEAVFRDNYCRTENQILVEAGERVGFVRLSADGDALVLEDLQVRPVDQNRGLGAWAMERVEDLARDRGLRAVRLRCFHVNPARRLYEWLGYTVAEAGEDADWMAKPVTCLTNSARLSDSAPRRPPSPPGSP